MGHEGTALYVCQVHVRAPTLHLPLRLLPQSLQTMALLDERLTLNEDRVRRMDEKLDAAIGMGGPGQQGAAPMSAGAKQPQAAGILSPRGPADVQGHADQLGS